MATSFKDINSYIKIQSPETQVILEKIRQTIKKAAPQAEEVISYNMPAFKYYGMLVYFAAYENHIGFYALPSGNKAFQKELSTYKQGKGSIQFPLNKPMPFDLITKIVKFRITENIEKVSTKKNLKTCNKGHKYYKSSDCPTCPICEEEHKPQSGFLSLISAPARRAIENKGIKTLIQLSKYTEKEILELHGMGISSIPKLKAVLKTEKLSFKK